MANRFLNNVTINDSYTLPSADGTENQIIVTDGAGNLSFNDLGTVTGAITGVESNLTYYEVKNSSGAQILKGKGVMAVGTDGNSGHILIDEMVADGSVEARYFLGVLSETLDNGELGRVIAFGELDQFNTNGQNGETWSNGQVLWCDPDSAGDFTITEPDGPNVKIPAAFILKTSTNGKIQIRVQANEGIHQLHDTKITAQADGELLVWNNTLGVWHNDGTATIDYTNGNVGIGTTSPNANLHVYSSGNGEIEVERASGALINFQAQASLGTIGTDSNHPLYFKTNGGTRMAIATSGNVGIGTTSPSFKLDVSGDGIRNIRSTAGWAGWFQNTASSSGVIITAGVDSGDAPLLVRKQDATEIFSVRGNGVSWFNGGNVGIGTTSPNTLLDVSSESSTIASFRATGGTSNNKRLEIGSGGDRTIIKSFTDTTDAASALAFSNGNSEAMRITSTGDVGVGTTSPSYKLDVNGDVNVPFGTSNGYRINGNRILSQGSGFFEFGALDYKSTYPNISTNSDGTFRIQSNGSTLVTVNQSGNVGIGTTNPDSLLHVSADLGSPNIGTITIEGRPVGSLGDDIATLDFHNYGTKRADIRMERGNTSTDSQLVFSTSDAGTLNDALIINEAGAFQFNQYGSGTFTGTAAQRLGVDSSGNVIEIPIGSGAVDGSGTANYVTKWTDADTIGNSIIYDNGTNVGVGTTSPSAKLDVVSDSGSSVQIRNTGTVASLLFAIDSSQNSIYSRGINSSTARDLRFIQGSAEAMRITSAGNVGIGTTSPDAQLQVNAASSGNVYFSGGSGDTRYLNFSTYDTISAHAGHKIDATSSNGEFAFAVGGSAKMYIKSSGNVGIGTSDPSVELEVSSATNAQILINSVSDTGNSQLYFGDSTSDTAGVILYRHADDSMAFEVNDLERMRIASNGKIDISGYGTEGAYLSSKGSFRIDIDNDNDHTDRSFIISSNNAASDLVTVKETGNVGIGTTSPLGRLQVNEYTVGAQGNQTVHGELSVFANSGDESLFLGIKDATYPNRGWAFNPVTNGVNSDLQIKEHGSSGVRMTIKTGGNVGIGTTSPGHNLNVSSPNNTTAVGIDIGANASFDFAANSTSGYTTLFYMDDIGLDIGHNSSGRSINFTTGGTDKLTILGGGNVGIGTTSPSQKLEVSGNIRLSNLADKIIFGSAGASPSWSGAQIARIGTQMTMSDYSGVQLGGYDGTSYGPRMTVLGTGNVGIGTTSPSSIGTGITTLDIEGSNAGGVAFGVSGTKNYIYGASTMYVQANTTAAFLTSGTEKMRITSSGNVGIGTTNPTAPLDTNGVRIGRDFSIANRGTVRIDSNGTAYPSDILFGHTAAANQSSWSGVYWSLSSRGTSDSGKFQLWRGSAHASPYNSELRVITVMPSGDTGIGETDPTQKLHVGGNIRVTGAYYDSNNSAGTSGQVLSSTATGTDWVSLSEISGVDGTGTANTVAMWSDADTITDAPITISGTAATFAGNVTTTGVAYTDYIQTRTGTFIDFRHQDASTIMRIDTDDARVGIGTTNPSEKLDVVGSIKHTGLTMTDGTDVDQLKTFSMTYQLSADTWTDTGINGGDLSTGTYVMQVYADDHSAGGQQYDEYYSATISWFGTATNSSVVDEIVVHRAGHGPNANDLQFRTVRHLSGGDNLMLQVKANLAHTATMNGTDGRTHTYKFRRLI